MGGTKNRGTKIKYKNRSRANSIKARLAYSPSKDKNKFTQKLRAKLQLKEVSVPLVEMKKVALKIGSININGMGMDSSWALSEIVKEYNLKV